MDKGITWIGFGEAAYHIAAGLKEQGFQKMAAFDPAADDPQRGSTIQAHAEKAGVTLFGSPEEAVRGMDFVVSLTSAKVAVAVAEQILPIMQAGQIFMDFNSAAPDTKRKIAQLERPAGVSVCDVAVMGPVPLNGYKVPLLIAGEGGEAFEKEFLPYGMKIEVLNAPPGGASAVKMIRSVYMKGFPLVMMECLLAAHKYGVTEKMLDSLEGTVGGKSLRALADQVFAPMVIHAARRSSEMKEVVQMLQADGMSFQMSEAAHNRLLELSSFIVDKMGDDVKPGYEEILAQLEKHREESK